MTVRALLQKGHGDSKGGSEWTLFSALLDWCVTGVTIASFYVAFKLIGPLHKPTKLNRN